MPEGYGNLTFLRRHIHPFLAEFSRKVRIDPPDAEPVYCPLPINVGGRTLINLYWIEEKDGFGPMLLMRDNWGEYLIDLERKKSFILIKPEAGRVFAGEINDERGGYGWGHLPNGDLRVHSCGKDATEITQYQVYDDLKYIGRLDGRTPRLRFIASSEAPEERVQMVTQ